MFNNDFNHKPSTAEKIWDFILGVILLAFALSIITTIFGLDPFNTYNKNVSPSDKAFYDRYPEAGGMYDCTPDPVGRGCF